MSFNSALFSAKLKEKNITSEQLISILKDDYNIDITLDGVKSYRRKGGKSATPSTDKLRAFSEILGVTIDNLINQEPIEKKILQFMQNHNIKMSSLTDVLEVNFIELSKMFSSETLIDDDIEEIINYISKKIQKTVTKEDILNFDNNVSPVKSVPIVANTSCGACDISSLQDFSQVTYISGLKWKKSLYALVACGDSMSSEINDGDELIVDPEIKPANGDIVHYKIDEESAVKVFVVDEDIGIMQFVPINSTDNFKTRTIRLDDEDTLNRLEVHKVISIIKTKVNNRASRLKMIGR